AVLKTTLWTALSDRTQALSEDLPDTGLPMALEAVLSSAFIDEPARGHGGYGTRCSTLVLAAPAGENNICWTIKVDEKTHTPTDVSQDTSAPMTISITSLQWKVEFSLGNLSGQA
ncbi:MAG: NRDE family protein, partial [Pseudomonadota bacterium]